MRINGEIVNGNKFAYDGCHKIYIIEDFEDEKQALNYDYYIYDIKDLEHTFNYSCELRFIHNWKLTKTYVSQFENARFEY